MWLSLLLPDLDGKSLLIDVPERLVTGAVPGIGGKVRGIKEVGTVSGRQKMFAADFMLAPSMDIKT